MGLIFSRFYDKPSTRDTLERIEQEIQNIEERRWDKIKREQFVVQILSFVPITILIVTFCILIYPSDSSWRDKLLLCVPCILLNLLLWVCRRIVQWYSRWSLDNEEATLRKLQKEKKKILEMVCETESYRVAAELLEKYDPKQLRRRERPHSHERPSSPMNSTLTKFTASPNRPQQAQAGAQQHQQHSLLNQSQQQLNQMSFMNQSLSFPVQTPAPPPPTPITKPMKPKNGPQPNVIMKSQNQHNTSIASPVVAASSVQGRPVRPVLSKDRSLFERLVDWVVADGPDNRFALICRYCYGHNGMSLAEEFETINFRCCYCYNLNTTTNKRQVKDQLQPDREKSKDEAPKATAATSGAKDIPRVIEPKQTSEKESSEDDGSEESDQSQNGKHQDQEEPLDESTLNVIQDDDKQVADDCKEREQGTQDQDTDKS